MNVVPGSAFFQTVSGSAARPDATRAADAAAQILQAQAVENGREAAQAGRTDTQDPARSLPYGPRGRLVDIIA